MDPVVSPVETGACAATVEDDIAIRYVRGELDDSERDAFERHYFSCDACTAVVCGLDFVLESSRDRHVIVVTKESVASAQVPATGLVVGRSQNSQLRVADPLVSRLHLWLHGGEPTTVEDLATATGTRVNKQPLVPRTPTEAAVGAVIEIGSTTLILQRGRGQDFQARPLLDHDHLRALVDDACLGGREQSRPFSVVHLAFDAGVSWTQLLPILVRRVQPPHQFAACGDRDYELLLLGGDDVVQPMVRALKQDLRVAGLKVRVGRARYPRDGLSASALFVCAKTTEERHMRGKDALSLTSLNAATQRMYDLASSAAAANLDVLLLGETGVGKEWMAYALHRLSVRAAQPLLFVNCAALSENLIEAELFGHEKGAFTGATQAKVGLLESAEAGTLVIDEIGELPLALQAKMIRVLATREIMRVGGVRPRRVDVRFVATTSRDLSHDIQKGSFRQDLYFRLAQATFTVPPLRERREDIPELARLFLAEACRDHKRAGLTLTDAAIATLVQWQWPGNVRELKNVIQRAVVLSSRQEIGPEVLGRVRLSAQAGVSSPSAERAAPVSADGERRAIEEALKASSGNQTRAAQMLGISRRTLVSHLQRHGIVKPPQDDDT